ncbi:MAG: TlpA family protein disulfide reductase [Proteobacteria bacterium]|nr:TlpA family protein disulfide reductase [Pseudomonadota bacterium]
MSKAKNVSQGLVRLIASGVVVAQSFSGNSANAAAPAAGSEFPAMEVTHLASGKKVQPYKPGSVTMVNLWATWCEACKVELAEMEKNLLSITGPNGSKPNLMFVSLDKEPSKARDWFKQNTKATDVMIENLYSDAGFELAEKLEADSFPMTVVIGKDGKILHVERGFKDGIEGVNQVKKIAALMQSSL